MQGCLQSGYVHLGSDVEGDKKKCAFRALAITANGQMDDLVNEVGVVVIMSTIILPEGIAGVLTAGVVQEILNRLTCNPSETAEIGISRLKAELLRRLREGGAIPSFGPVDRVVNAAIDNLARTLWNSGVACQNPDQACGIKTMSNDNGRGEVTSCFIQLCKQRAAGGGSPIP